jgi:energy-coupling factor transporter ATP-binding protein EcfA2
MIIHRLRVEHFRGIDQVEVQFDAPGVTVVCGPNEAGKSSLAEAITLLLERKASSQAVPVRAVKPVHVDEGSTVELEATLGPYRFVYQKRFHKKPQTTLSITRPEVRNYTGDAAHEQVERMLGDHLDEGLWGALRIVQGSPLGSPKLASSTSLLRALDGAAGGGFDEAEETVYSRARAEYLQYFTATGRPGQPLRTADEAARQHEDAVNQLSARLEDLEEAVEECEQVDRDIAKLEERVPELEAHKDDRQAEWAAVQAVMKEVDTCTQARDLAEAKAETAQARWDARRALLREIEQLEQRIGEAQRQRAALAPALDEARDAVEAVQAEEGSAGAAVRAATERLEAARRDAELLRVRGQIGDLDRRLGEVHSIRTERDEAQEIVDQTRVSPAAIDEIEAAEERLLRADAQLGAGTPTVSIEARTALGLSIQGERTDLQEGEVERRQVAASTRISILDVADIVVQPSEDAAALADRRQRAEQAVGLLLDQVGATSSADARGQLQRKLEAERAITRLNGRLAILLEGAREADLERELGDLKRSQARLEAGRPEGFAMPRDQSAAEGVVDAARSSLDRATATHGGIEKRLERATAHLSDLKNDAQDADITIRQLELAAGEKAVRLDEERNESPDDRLEEALRSAAAAAASHQEALDAATRRLERMDPSSARLLATNAASAHEEAIRGCETFRIAAAS